MFVGGTTYLVLSGSDNVGITTIHYAVSNGNDLIV